MTKAGSARSPRCSRAVHRAGAVGEPLLDWRSLRVREVGGQDLDVAPEAVLEVVSRTPQALASRATSTRS